MSKLILPGHPLFDETLLKPRPDFRKVVDQSRNQFAHVVDAESGLLRPVSDKDLDEYLLGGEYDARMQQIGLGDDWEFEPLIEPIEDDSIFEPDELVHIAKQV